MIFPENYCTYVCSVLAECSSIASVHPKMTSRPCSCSKPIECAVPFVSYIDGTHWCDKTTFATRNLRPWVQVACHHCKKSRISLWREVEQGSCKVLSISSTYIASQSNILRNVWQKVSSHFLRTLRCQVWHYRHFWKPNFMKIIFLFPIATSTRVNEKSVPQ